MAMSAFEKMRLYRRKPGVGLLVPAFFLIIGCDFPGRPKPADRPVPADQILDFNVLYRQNCAGCHGASGNLGPAPPLRDPIFRAIVPKAELDEILTKGRQNTLMPAFGNEHGGTLTTAQIQVLVHEIKAIPYRIETTEDGSISKAFVVADDSGIHSSWGPPGDPPNEVPSYRKPSGSSNGGDYGNLATGAEVYARSCADCHGDHGQGIVQGNATINAINDSVVLNLISDQALRRMVITGRPDLGMPSFAEALTGSTPVKGRMNQDVTDVVSLLASWRKKTVDDN